MAWPDNAGIDPYIDPRTGLLRNLVGAQSKAELDEIETFFSSLRAYELERTPIAGKLDLSHLCAMHKFLFSDVYPWAGELRTVDMKKGESRFASAAVIEIQGDLLFNELAQENGLRGLDLDAFSEHAGYFLGEINALHPFREGNGRAQRAFIGQLAAEAGYHIGWDRVSRGDMTWASIMAERGDPGVMARLIRANLTLFNHDEERAAKLARPAGGDQTMH